MRALDVLGRRWSLRILWELRRGPLTFRELRAACDVVSPSSLAKRVADLRDLGVLELGAVGYALTARGQALARILRSLNRWAEGS